MRVDLRSAARVGWSAVVANARPFVLIQACAFGLVFAYYGLPGLRAAAEGAARLKASGGFLFSALATVFAGLVLPEIAKRLTRTSARLTVRDVLFQCAFFATIGMIVDALYRLLALCFGTGVGWDVVLRKVLVDQFVFSPVVSITLSTAAFMWREFGFSFRRLGEAVRSGAYLQRYVPTLLTCWAYWMPVLIAVYAMPPNLQFVLFLFAQAAWSLLLVAVTAER